MTKYHKTNQFVHSFLIIAGVLAIRSKQYINDTVHFKANVSF